MPRFEIESLRNLAFVGHGACGKTTLADLILFKTGQNNRAGSVDDQTSMLDTDEEEHHSKHTITSSVCHFDHDGHHISLVETPGYPDFVGQVLGGLRAVETAVIVLNASAGIEVNARKTFRYAADAGLARMFVINKCDAENVRFPELIEAIQSNFGTGCALMNVPVGLGSQFTGVVPTIGADASASAVVNPNEAGQQVIDAAVEADEELMERYLEGAQLTPEEMTGAIRTAIATGDLIPIFCTSAKKDVGVDELLDGIARYAPPPSAVRRAAHDPEGGEHELSQTPEDPLVAQVFKTRIDPFVGKMSYVRVFTGTLKKDASVHHTHSSKHVKLSQLVEIQGSHHEPLAEAGPGEIVAVVKVEDLQTGDTISHGADDWTMPKIPFPTPMIGLAVEPKTQADQQKISAALHKIEEEDRTFVVKRDSQTKEIVMQGMSELHLQVVEHRLQQRDKVEIITHPPKVPYRETVNGAAEGSYRHKKQSGGSGQFAEVHMRISHCPQGIDPEEYFTKDRFESMRSYHYDPDLNFAFVDRISGGSIPNQFIPAVEKGVRERMERGVIAGNQVQDVVVELFFGKDHPVDSNETAFKTAGSMCFRNVFQEAKPSLLEPIVSMEIFVPADKLGDITSDLNTRRGRMEGMDGAPGGFQIIHAKAPLAEVMTYARSLSSMTGGQGSFTLEFSHYEVVPGNEQARIVAEAKQQDEEEH